MSRILVFISSSSSLLLLLSACAKSTLGPTDESAQHHHKPIAAGSILAHIEKLQSHPKRGACDRDPDVVSAQLEIARAIDAHEAEIQAAVAARVPGDEWQSVTVGPIQVRERVGEPPRTTGTWANAPASWKSIIHYYEKIKANPQPKEWLILNSMVRGIIPDDQARLQRKNMFHDRDSGPFLKKAIAAFSACIADAECLMPDFDAETRIFMNGNVMHFQNLLALSEMTDKNEKREFLKEFKEILEDGNYFYDFKANPLVKRTDATHFILPIDPGIFSDSADAQTWLSATIEKYWQSPTHSLKIKWKKLTPEFPGLFTILLASGTAGRSSVNWEEKKMRLFSGVRAPSIAHEIGHVLGFTDNYYTVWQPEYCRYNFQYLDSDIMSDSEAGSVTSEHWKILAEKYPLPEVSTAVEPVTPDAQL